MILQKLFEPTRIGTMTLKNRIAMPAMETNLGSAKGFVTARLKRYYEERAYGGAGLIIVQMTCVDYPRGKATAQQIGIDDDKYLKGLSDLAQGIKKAGAKAAIQLEHGGRYANSAITGQQPVGPSASSLPVGEPVRELSVMEIEELTERHARAAARARKAGFDGVEIHGAHGHLIAQFICPAINQRQDQYGGSLENRARFLLEVIRACRLEVGPDFPIWCRIDGMEYGIEPGIDFAQSVQVARWVEEAGADAVHVSGHGFGVQFITMCPGMPGFHLAGAAIVRRNVKVPVIAVGRILPEIAEWALREEVADIIAMGRALIADPQLPNKAAAGALDDIVPCISCLECVQAVGQGIAVPTDTSPDTVRCSVNPAVGREDECSLSTSPIKRRVLVVGGGPAGMEAARVARLRGHDVTLIEKDNQLGGQLIPAAAPPHKEAIALLIDYLTIQMTKLGVKVELGKEATLETIAEARPDAVVWAGGASSVIPEIPGIDTASTVPAVDVLSGRAIVGDTVVVIGAELVGCETASFLADQGKRVTVVRRGPQVLAKANLLTQIRLLDDLTTKGVELLTGVKYEGFDSEGLVIRTEAGRVRNLKADTFVLATGARPESGPLQDLKDRSDNIYVAGDALEPRRIRDAVVEGFEIGRTL